ncbi:MAG: riboflavin synthase [Cyanobacteria bacterium]|nr:riboflavin synthase [Cyanobacteria bacterium CG_2015-16_32_12]NCO79067.1 riboflavin synthase [Cyanobacteria bacterium CG_2015-22_32_23]NCQ05217.1 riboflavin synthase [Cyanobacteria bacterium CG_2015-09_32_10]NCQ42397.1 riboflavin synthase [Cyanobacteria bacterium CG_2015-04_32_10]NCS86007.1 riboflavin synthase [Cyanobacteria bacterium CG_2015-02_32_10]
MFTGLIQGKGKIKAKGNNLFIIDIEKNRENLICQDLAIGDSVAVDGICLTVEKILQESFIATASPETLQRTTLEKNIQKQKNVNLETSLRVGSKIGGHFVTGHVDGIGCLVESVNCQQSWEMTFTAPSGLKTQWQNYISPYIVSKASIAVNGISLTIADCDIDGNWFNVAVIPHTYAQTNLSQLQSGDWVNLESDILGKYVDKLIRHRVEKTPLSQDISLDFLLQNGYN